MHIQEIHKFYRGNPPPNAWEGEKKYAPPKPRKRRKKPATPPKRYYA